MAHLGTRVAAYVDGQLTDDEHAAASGHLDGCDECRRAVDQHERLKARLSTLSGPVSPSDRFVASLCDVEHLRASAPPSGLRAAVDRLLHGTPVRAALALGGASVAVTLVAYLLGGPQPDDTPAVTPDVDRLAAMVSDPDSVVETGDRPPARTYAGDTAAVVSASTDRLPVVPGETTPDIFTHGGDDDPAAARLLGAAAGEVLPVDELLDRYSVAYGGWGMVDGLDVRAVTASRAGRIRVTYWIDPDGSRLLSRVADDGQGNLVETTGFALPRGTLSEDRLGELTEAGWPCHDRLGRGLTLQAGRWTSLGAERVVHLTYTDGVATVDLFEQYGRLDPDGLDGFVPITVAGREVWVRTGVPFVAVWDADDMVYTAVTEHAPGRLADMVAGLPEQASAPSLVERVGSGLRRLA